MEEFISYDEFFDEVGMEINNLDMKKKILVSQIIKQQKFIIQRLGYETTYLHRDREKKKIIWERKICGIIIKSEFEDFYPDEMILVAADQFEKLGDAIYDPRTKNKYIVVIGHYEYQNYILKNLTIGILFQSI